MKFKKNHIYQGNALDILHKLPEKSVHCMVTSPPYFLQRSYGTEPQIWGGDKSCKHEWAFNNIPKKDGGHNSPKLNIKGKDNFQSIPATKYGTCIKCGSIKSELGRNPTIKSYVNGLCDIFDEAKRVLVDYGSLWVNIGDKNNDAGGAGNLNAKYRKKHTQFGKKVVSESQSLPARIKNIPKQSQMLVPERFAIEMVDRGWILKNVIILHKLGGMPTSYDRKFTVNYEYMYFFVKKNTPTYYINKLSGELVTKKPLGTKGVEGKDWFHNDNNNKQSYWTSYSYFFNQQFDPLKYPNAKGMEFGGNKAKNYGNGIYSGNKYDASELIGKNKRAIWEVSTANLKENHFAAYDVSFIRSPISAGCPELICSKCGLPQQPFYKKGKVLSEWKSKCGADSNGEYKGKAQKDYDKNKVQNASDTKRRILKSLTTKKKCIAKCNCGAEFTKGIVLDVFNGSGTSCIEAINQHKNFIGIELKKEYIDIAWKRITPYYDPNGLW